MNKNYTITMKNIGLLVDVETLIGSGMGGGEKVESYLAKNLTEKHEDIYIIPKLRNFYLFNNHDLVDKLKTYRVIAWDRLKDRDINIEYILKYITNEINSFQINLLIDLNYAPGTTYQNIINTGIKNFSDNLLLKFGEIVYLTSKCKIKGAILLQGEGLNKISFGIPSLVFRSILSRYGKKLPFDIFINKKNKIHYTVKKGILEWSLIKLVSEIPRIVRIYGVSEGQFVNLGLSRSKKIKLIDPPFGIPYDLQKYKDFRKSDIDKEDYLVYYARMLPLKGIVELLYIIYEIKRKKRDIKLYTMGYFDDKYLENLFYSKIKELGLQDNVIYLGFIDNANRAKQFDIITRAKAFIYPTHEDSFSLSILESIYLRTPVITYDLLGPKSVYQMVPLVRFVKEFDHIEMAMEVNKILEMNNDQYNSFISDPRIDQFLEKFTKHDSIIQKYYDDFQFLLGRRE